MIDTDQTLEGFELSPQQKRIWRRMRCDGEGAYRVQVVAPAGDLSEESLERALGAAVGKHEILRTVFRCLAGMELPLQMIPEEGRYGWSVAGSEEELADHCRKLREEPFDLKNGPNFRGSLHAASGGERSLVLTVPALCCDVYGLQQLAQEILESAASGSGGEAAGDEEMLQYADLAQWQNELLTAEETAPGREYWRAVDLRQGLEAALPVRAGEPPSEAQPGALAPEMLEIGEVFLPEELREDPAPWLSSVWWALLRRRGAPEGALGVELDGRRYAELEAAVGPLAKTVPVTLKVSSEASRDPFAVPFSSLVSSFSSALEAAETWQESFSWRLFEGRFEEAAEDVYLPLGFACIPGAGGPAAWAASDRFELRLQASLFEDRALLSLVWDPRCYRRMDVERLGKALMTLAAAARERPEAQLGTLPMLGEAERRQLLEAWSGVGVSAGPPPTVVELFAESVEGRSDRLALVAEDGRWTYGELGRQVALLASRLQKAGVGPETVVALPAIRRGSTLVSLLAILRAGGAYLPLDMTQPEARQALLLEKAGVSRILGDREELGGLPPEMEFLPYLSEDETAAGTEPPRVAAPAIHPESLAYVLFTSGSTGAPKGVAVSHGSLTRYVSAATERLGLEDDGTFATVSTLAADLGHTMIFPALLRGGCLLLAGEEDLGAPERLAARFEELSVDYLKIVPSHLAALLEIEDAARLLPRRALVCGGEALPPELLEKLARLAPELPVFNHFGPTETTVGVTAGPVLAGQKVTLGEPLPACRIFLADPALEAVPVGSPGELLIGGPQVSRGYFRQPRATAERFLPDPFSGEPGSRLYRSGDRARFGSEGGLEFLGRADDQVKIRGFRVELGEIEAALSTHPGVARPLVLLGREPGSAQALLAYFEPAAGRAPAPAELRAHVAGLLPEVMVPAHFILVESFPRNANGKLDRGALPAPDEASRRGTDRAPTPVEEMVLDLWRPLLGREEISLTDDFFALGGHSLTAMQLTVRLAKTFGVQLAVDRIFEAPTPERLARAVEDLLKEGASLEVPPLVPRPEGAPAPLSFSQERHWFLQQLDPASPLYNIRGALQVTGNLDVKVLEACFQEIIRRHELLRTAYPAREIPVGAGPSGDLGPVQEIHEDLPFQIPVSDLRSLPDNLRESVMASLAADSGLRPFAMEKPPFLRVEALQTADEEFLLVLTLHHIVADRWTLNLLIQEISALYPAFAEGRPSPLAPLDLQYADFAYWQRSWLQGAVLERELTYWKKELEGAPPVLELPQARRRPPRLSGRSGRLPFQLSGQARDELKAIGRSQGMTLFQTLLTVFELLLHGFTGEEDIVVGSPVAGRNQLETEGLVGCFINAIALRARFRGDPTFVDLLGRLKKTMLGAYTHQELPFERLVQELAPARSGGVAPIFQVVFNFADRPVEPLELPGLVFAPWRPESVLDAKYDLILSMFDGPDGVQAFLTYSSDLFDTASMGRLAAQFQLLVDRIGSRPEAPCSELVVGIRDEEQRARFEQARELKGRRKESLVGARRSAVRNLAKETSKS